jgi:hypothetical protein
VGVKFVRESAIHLSRIDQDHSLAGIPKFPNLLRIGVILGKIGFTQEIFRNFQMVQRGAGPLADPDPAFPHFGAGPPFRGDPSVLPFKRQTFE